MYKVILYTVVGKCSPSWTRDGRCGIDDGRQRREIAEVLLVENASGVARLCDVCQVVQVVRKARNGSHHGASKVQVDDAQEERNERRVERTFDDHQQCHRLLFHEIISGPQSRSEQQVLERVVRYGHTKVDNGRRGRYGHHRQRQRCQTPTEYESRAEVQSVPGLLVVASSQWWVDGRRHGDGQEHGAGQAAVEQAIARCVGLLIERQFVIEDPQQEKEHGQHQKSQKEMASSYWRSPSPEQRPFTLH